MTELIANRRHELSAKAVLTAAADKAPFETDWRKLSTNGAICVVLAETAAQLAACLRLGSQAGVAVVPPGGNTGLVAGGVPAAGCKQQVILNRRRMNKIRDLDALRLRSRSKPASPCRPSKRRRRAAADCSP